MVSHLILMPSLGDRHGENLLCDARTGEIVHVDFGCLFFTGQLLKVPETVPFRLTHNMVDAMGITGYVTVICFEIIWVFVISWR